MGCSGLAGALGALKESKVNNKRAASGGLCCCAYTLPTTYWALLFVLSTRPSRSLLFALASTCSFFLFWVGSIHNIEEWIDQQWTLSL